MNPKIKVENLLFAGSSSMADLLKTPRCSRLKDLIYEIQLVLL